MRALLTIALLLAAPPAAFAAAAAPDELAAAQAAYQSGEYAEAAAAYRNLLELGVVSADVYFNLGTAELRAGRRGHAILAFERALRLDPTDADVAFNLGEARRGNIDKVLGAREEPPLIERIGERVPAWPAGIVFVAAWVLGVLALLLRWLQNRARAALAFAGWLGIALAAVSGGLLAAAAWHQTHARYAVVVAPAASVREGPAADFKASFEIHEGLKVRVVRQDGAFTRIRLPNGIEGWVSESEVPRI